MKDSQPKQRWLLLSSSTGTGHNMRANSLALWARNVFGEDQIEISTSQALESTHRIYGFGVGLYNFIQRKAPWLHHVYFNYLEIAGMHRKASRIMGTERFKQVVRATRPDRVISVHAHTNHGYFELVRSAAEEAGFAPPACITYCGELFAGYGFSRHWSNAAADGFIGATSEVCAAARAIGLPSKRTYPGGFLLRPHFYLPATTLRERAITVGRQLDLDPEAFTLFVSTGLAGANNHPAIVHALGRSGPEPLQVIMACGQREDTQRKLTHIARQYPHLSVRPLGPIDPARMASLKTLASVVVARPGTGTTSEAIQLGVPLIHNRIGGIMPQELITAQYCKHHHCTLQARSPEDVATKVRRLQSAPDECATLRTNLLSARPKGTPEDIVRWIARCQVAS